MNGEMREHLYSAPVSQFLSLGEPIRREWRDYAALGISPEHIPDLIRMATDERLNNAPGDSALVWAPAHAWRALGQLRAAEAVMPLLSLFRRIKEFDDDWVQSDVPEALAQIGAPALEPAAHYLADTSHDDWPRLAAAETLGEIGRAHPDLRAECVAKLAAQLEKFSEQQEFFNAFLIAPLWDLRAVEVLPLIERAYAAGRVDESITGHVEDVQIHFGLKTKREHPPRPRHLTALGERLAELRERVQALEQENAELRSLLEEPAFDLPSEPYVAPAKIGRNEPCPCGSGKKYKKCCGG